MTDELKSPIFMMPIQSIILRDRGRKDYGDVTDLATSIKTHGLLNPIVVDSDGILIAGGRRLAACIILNRTHIEARDWGSLSDLERRQIELEENIKRKQLTWQEEVGMTQELHSLMQQKHPQLLPPVGSKQGRPPAAWGIQQTADLLGVTSGKISQDLTLAKAIAVAPDIAKVSSKTNANRMLRKRLEMAAMIEIQSRAAAKGSRTDTQLLVGDCTLLMPKMAEESVDLIITDPPWGIDIEHAAREWIRQHNLFHDDQESARVCTEIMLQESFRVLRPGSHMYMFTAWETLGYWQERMVSIGFWVRPSPLIWVKGNVTPGQPNWLFMNKTESIIFAHKGQGGRILNNPSSDVLQYDSPHKRIHPTQKPVDMLRYLISLSTIEGDTVLDPFTGSGSTVCAAILSKRKGIGIELDPEMCKAAEANLIVLASTPTEPQVQ